MLGTVLPGLKGDLDPVHSSLSPPPHLLLTSPAASCSLPPGEADGVGCEMLGLWCLE